MSTSEERRSRQGRVFTIELKTGSGLKKVNVPNGAQRILVEGTIGPLKHAEFVEDAVLELAGTEGVLRVDLSTEDLAKSSQESQEAEDRGWRRKGPLVRSKQGSPRVSGGA